MGPRNAIDVRTQVEDFVVAEYDLAEAKRLGLDHTPQFLEDRRNFALNQALALYEQEVLSKIISIQSDELTTLYQTDLQRYSSPVEVTGTLFIYLDAEESSFPRLPLWHPDGSVSGSQPDRVIDPTVVRRDDPTSSIGIPYAFLVSLPVEGRLGPFPYRGGHAVFLKRAVGALVPRPFGQVEPELRSELRREKIKDAELRYLEQNWGRVHVYLNLEDYGLSAIGPVK
jgi:hypothetical protein